MLRRLWSCARDPGHGCRSGTGSGGGGEVGRGHKAGARLLAVVARAGVVRRALISREGGGEGEEGGGEDREEGGPVVGSVLPRLVDEGEEEEREDVGDDSTGDGEGP